MEGHVPKKTDAEPQSRFLSASEAARALGYTSTKPVYDLIYKDKALPATQLRKGGDLRIPRADFDAFCERLAEEARTRFGAA